MRPINMTFEQRKAMADELRQERIRAIRAMEKIGSFIGMSRGIIIDHLAHLLDFQLRDDVCHELLWVVNERVAAQMAQSEKDLSWNVLVLLQTELRKHQSCRGILIEANVRLGLQRDAIEEQLRHLGFPLDMGTERVAV